MANPIPQSCSTFDVPCHATWLVAQLEAFGSWLYQHFINAAASLIDVIPVPDFLLNIQTVTIPSSVTFWLSPFNLNYGIGIIVSAYVARFILRRIPIIG